MSFSCNPGKYKTNYRIAYQILNAALIEHTDENGEFFIENAQYLEDAGKDNYYGNFTFAGDDKYQGCTYIGNVTVIPN